MMGNRNAVGGDEHEAFSRRWRKLIPWRRGDLRTIKRGFWKRTRKGVKNAALNEARNAE